MEVHETAFVVSTYRAIHESISQDIYAKYWNNAATDALLPEIFNTISKHEALLHAIRNRYFLDQLKRFFNKNKGGTLINFGAGFSMYQFLLEESVHTIEIDKKEILAYKKQQVDNWIKAGKLPVRQISYANLDFNNSTMDAIVATIRPFINEKPTFILLEGVLFFLDRNTSVKLFNSFGKLQQSGDVVGCVSYIPEIENKAVYKRLLNYFDRNNHTGDSFYHQTIDASFYHQFNEYQLLKSNNELELLNQHIDNPDDLKEDDILNEHFYLLEKTID